MNQITTLICVSAQCHLKYCICSVIADYLGGDISPQGCGGAHRDLLYGHIPSLIHSEIIDSDYFPVVTFSFPEFLSSLLYQTR